MNINHNLAYRVRLQLLNSGRVLIALFIFSIYFSTSLAVIFSVGLGLVWLLSTRFIDLPGVLKKYPVALWALMLYGCFILGLSYGNAAGSDAVSMASKYRELLFIPILISLLTAERNRYWAWRTFIAASVITLLVSYLMDLGILNLNEQGGACFKSRITHGIFIAFFAFFCAHKIYDDKRYAKLYLALFVLCLYNLFFVIEGRTGQLIVVALILLFAMQRMAIKECLFAALITAVLLILFLNFSDKASRITEGVANTQAFLQPVPEQTESSMGQRYTFWKYSLKLMAEKPLLGHGTGSFAKEYQRIAIGEPFITKNPHNEFLMIGVQLGLLGLLVYLGFLASQLYCARKLPFQQKWLAQGLLLSLVIASLFNTPFFDHTEGHWYAAMIALCFAALGSDNKIISSDA
ncbi:MAG: O-antigen ligase domain-containing protein [Methylobacter sp.]|nr:MAG: O-antigen ligase domain-containing protein [Methylobacter sp.]